MPELHQLLDEAFLNVSKRTQEGKRFLNTQSGQAAQLVAISYTVSEAKIEPPLKKRKQEKDGGGGDYMNVHFANLVDDQFTKVVLKEGVLQVDCKDWIPRCVFPDVQDDMLLYLAVLGGKGYSGYYDHNSHTAHSTKSIFSRYMQSKGLAFSEKTYAVKNDYAAFENMVAHAIFCASRRNGVRGISFNDFFAGLLGELQDEFEPKRMTIDGSSETIVASDLLVGFDPLTSLSEDHCIPFLAPPNAEWPASILKGDGCNFGHLVRSPGEERCDTYVIDVYMPDRPLFICECQYWNAEVGSDNLGSIIGGLETVWGEKWTIALLFCAELAGVKTREHKEIGCVKIKCETCSVTWIHQPHEGKRKKLLVVIEMGRL